MILLEFQIQIARLVRFVEYFLECSVVHTK